MTRCAAVLLGCVCLTGCPAPDPTDRTEQGVLEEGDEVHGHDNSFYDDYSVRVAAGWRLTVELSSTDFDSYLQVYGPDGELAWQNDDIAPDNLNARVQETAESAGTYDILANSRAGGETGAYTIHIHAGPAPAAASSAPTSAAAE